MQSPASALEGIQEFDNLLLVPPQGLGESCLDGPGSIQDAVVATAALHNAAAPRVLSFLAQECNSKSKGLPLGYSMKYQRLGF